MIALDRTVVQVCRAVVSGAYMKSYFVGQPLTEPFELYRSGPLDVREMWDKGVC